MTSLLTGSCWRTNTILCLKHTTDYVNLTFAFIEAGQVFMVLKQGFVTGEYVWYQVLGPTRVGWLYLGPSAMENLEHVY